MNSVVLKTIPIVVKIISNLRKIISNVILKRLLIIFAFLSILIRNTLQNRFFAIIFRIEGVGENVLIDLFSRVYFLITLPKDYADLHDNSFY